MALLIDSFLYKQLYTGIVEYWAGVFMRLVSSVLVLDSAFGLVRIWQTCGGKGRPCSARLDRKCRRGGSLSRKRLRYQASLAPASLPAKSYIFRLLIQSQVLEAVVKNSTIANGKQQVEYDESRVTEINAC